LLPLALQLHVEEPIAAALHHAGLPVRAANLGSGRIAASETEAPNMLANLV
jgi:hypothetical protein